MKSILLLLLLSLVSLDTFSQDSNPKTKIESILVSKGEVIQKEYEDLYEFKSTLGEYINFRKIKIVSLKSNSKVYGLFVKILDYESIPREGYTFLDQNEIIGLIDYLNFVLEKVKTIESKQTEYLFNSNDFQVVLFNSKVDPKKTFPKEEQTYNYWVLNFNVNKIGKSQHVIKNITEIIPLIEKLKELKFE
jgi:hypothetical protein